MNLGLGMQAEARVISRSAVAALLDEATPLHAAALRGNPAQIDHLLFCKANPMARTAAGDLPFELVPQCSDTPSGELLVDDYLVQLRPAEVQPAAMMVVAAQWVLRRSA